MVPLLALAAVLLTMAGEAALSAYNARLLRGRGAVEAPDPVWPWLRWAYPLAFVAMAAEGVWRGGAPPDVLMPGLAVLGFAKALKVWAMGTLGWRWTFRVLVPPGMPVVTGGPYRLMRHPTYAAVLGELAGMLLIAGAPITGLLALAGVGGLLIRRMRVEDRALGRQ